MKLSVVMPVYNERESIEEIVDRVLNSGYQQEIIIVDDGSDDGTRDILRKIAERHDNINVYYHDVNMGKTAAIRTALKYITADIVIIQDGDLEYNPSDYKQLTDPIIRGESDVVYGSRFLNVNKFFFVWHWFIAKLHERPYEIMYLSNFFGIQLLNIAVLLLYGVKISDIATGYKVFKNEVIKGIRLNANRFEFCYEVTAKIAKKHIKIKEVVIGYNPRSHLKGKKITWKDGVYALWTLVKYRFVD
jgi:glycosyltransferase involved in cell wall biosynthesis